MNNNTELPQQDYLQSETHLRFLSKKSKEAKNRLIWGLALGQTAAF